MKKAHLIFFCISVPYFFLGCEDQSSETVLIKELQNRIALLEKQINENHIKLVKLRDKLINTSSNISRSDLQKFKILKNQYISLVKHKEVYIQYRIKINGINLEQETQSVLISQLDSRQDNTFYHKDISYILKIIRHIDISVINEINNEENRLFDLYQDIMQNMDNPDQNKIKEYISRKHLKSLKQKIKDENDKQNNYIDFIVHKLPKIERNVKK